MKKSRHRHCRGVTIAESMIALCVMLLIFFSLLQIYRWCMAQTFCHYGSFYGAKGVNLGYQLNIALRAVRVGAAAVSGPWLDGGRFEGNALHDYMINGDKSGVRYEYWHPQTADAPCLEVTSQKLTGEVLDCRAHLVNFPLWKESIKYFIFGNSKKDQSGKDNDNPYFLLKNPEPQAMVESFNFSEIVLDYEK